MVDFTIGVGIFSRPEKVFAGVAHILSCSEFEELFNLCFSYLWVGPECIRKFVVGVWIIFPFVDVRELVL